MKYWKFIDNCFCYWSKYFDFLIWLVIRSDMFSFGLEIKIYSLRFVFDYKKYGIGIIFGSSWREGPRLDKHS